MKIVVLDGYTAVQNDLSWKEIEMLGDVTVYDRTRPEETVDRCSGAEAVLTNKVIMSEDVINHLPSLKYIGVLATGYNVVDIEAAHKRGIVVTNIEPLCRREPHGEMGTFRRFLLDGHSCHGTLREDSWHRGTW